MKRLGIMSLVLCLLLSACGNRAPVQGIQFAMDTVFSYTIYGDKGQQGLDAAIELMELLEGQLSVTGRESEIARYNRGETGALSQQTQALVARSEAMELALEGAFSPWLGAVTALWGFTTDAPHRPEEQALKKALADRGKLDLGGIAKGYAANRLRETWQDLGITSAVAALGGNVLTLGEKENGQAWKVGIRNPFGGEEATLGTLEVRDTCVVTSGGYERNFTEQGVTYHHILDPKTGTPAESGLAGVTVICRDGERADALSTGLFVLGRDRALELWRQSDNYELILVEKSGTVTVTAGVWDAFSATEEGLRYVREE